MNTNLLQTLHKNNTTYDQSLSDQYAPVSTQLLLKPFFDKGWYIHKHTSQFNKKGLGKENVTLRNDDYMYSNGDFLTIECLNSNNGSQALLLMGGYGRIACSNGLVIGDVEHGRFIHRGTRIYEKLNNKYDQIVAHLDRMKTEVDKLKERELDKESTERVIYNIANRIFNKDSKKSRVEVKNITPYAMRQLRKPRRTADLGFDAFTRMNVVQENIIRRGLLWANVEKTNKETSEVELTTMSKNRCENKISAIDLNKIITEEFLREVA